MALTALQVGICDESSSSNTFWNQWWRSPGLKADQHFEESHDIGNKNCFAWGYFFYECWYKPKRNK